MSQVEGVHDRHLVDLRASGLSAETIRDAGIRSLTGADAKELVGRNVGPALAFPYPRAVLEGGAILHRLKPDRPRTDDNGRAVKYESPSRRINPSGNRLYIPATLDPEVLADAQRPLVITEGEKKTLKAIQEGFDTVGLGGVWSWRTRAGERSVAIDDLDLIVWRDRTVVVIFDSDAATNVQVRSAENALVKELRRRGAHARVVRLPSPSTEEAETFGGKLGLDDFLVSRGPGALGPLVDEAIARLPLGCESITTILSEPDRPMPWLVEGIWPEEGCGFFAGEPKTKKSWFVLALALAIVAGVSFLGHSVSQGRVILFDEENNRRALRDRVRRLAAGMSVSTSGLDDLMVAGPGQLRLDRPEAMDGLRELVARVRPKLVILDPFVRFHRGNEKDAESMSPMLSDLRDIQRKFGTSIIIVHHLRKQGQVKASLGQRMRGSSDLHGWLDAAVYFESSKDATKLSFESRYTLQPDPMGVRLVDVDEATAAWVVSDGDHGENHAQPPSMEERVLDALQAERRPLSRTELSKKLRVAGKHVVTAVNALVERGCVREFVLRTAGRPKQMVVLVDDDGAAGLSDEHPPCKEGSQKVRKLSDASGDRSNSERQCGLRAFDLSDTSESESRSSDDAPRCSGTTWLPFPKVPALLSDALPHIGGVRKSGSQEGIADPGARRGEQP